MLGFISIYKNRKHTRLIHHDYYFQRQLRDWAQVLHQKCDRIIPWSSGVNCEIFHTPFLRPRPHCNIAFLAKLTPSLSLTILTYLITSAAKRKKNVFPCLCIIFLETPTENNHNYIPFFPIPIMYPISPIPHGVGDPSETPIPRIPAEICGVGMRNNTTLPAASS